MKINLKNITLATLILVTSTSVARADQTKAYAWIKSQQRECGLVRNQQDDSFCGLYVTALAAIAYLRQGDRDRVERMFDHLDSWRTQNWGSDLALQGFPQAWNADTGVADMQSDRWVGDNAWLLLALEYYASRTGSTKYDAMRNAIADWLVALQDSDGGIKAGFNRNGPMTHKSTEGNLDCYAVLIHRPTQRARVYEWLTKEMWIPEEKRFQTGSTTPTTALDCVSWAVAALGPDYASCLEYAERHYLLTAPMKALPGKTATGFGDLPGKERVWFEGTGEMIVAYRVAGRHADAERWIREMDKVALEVGPGEIGWPCSSDEPAWNGASTRPFVASGAWYLFGCWQLNPMNPSSWNETNAYKK